MALPLLLMLQRIVVCGTKATNMPQLSHFSGFYCFLVDFSQLGVYNDTILILRKECVPMNKPITEMYEDLPKIIKILIQIFAGAIVSGLYRVLRFLETKNITTLVVGIISLCTGGLFGILWAVDLITEILKNRVTVLAA
jgi:hypothetical protein